MAKSGRGGRGDTAVNWPSKSYTDRITGGRLFTAQRMFPLSGGREQRRGQTPKIISIWLCVCVSADGNLSLGVGVGCRGRVWACRHLPLFLLKAEYDLSDFNVLYSIFSFSVTIFISMSFSEFLFLFFCIPIFICLSIQLLYCVI
jgi:hypothetical protein